jgi:hypothetical protein
MEIILLLITSALIQQLRFQISDLVSFPLRRIHAGLLCLIEDDETQEENSDAQHRADGDLMKCHGSLTHEGEAK